MWSYNRTLIYIEWYCKNCNFCSFQALMYDRLMLQTSDALPASFLSEDKAKVLFASDKMSSSCLKEENTSTVFHETVSSKKMFPFPCLVTSREHFLTSYFYKYAEESCDVSFFSPLQMFYWCFWHLGVFAIYSEMIYSSVSSDNF